MFVFKFTINILIIQIIPVTWGGRRSRDEGLWEEFGVDLFGDIGATVAE